MGTSDLDCVNRSRIISIGMATSIPDREAYVDPRVRRTHEMLGEALENLLATTDFDKISVADIAEAATLSRATFYLHFLDKVALLEWLVAKRFRDLMEYRQIKFDGTCPSAIQAIALAVCDFLADLPFLSEQRQLQEQFESAMVRIMRKTLIEGLRAKNCQSGIEPDMIASACAGAIYSAARVWISSEDRSAADVAAAKITQLVKPMIIFLD